MGLPRWTGSQRSAGLNSPYAPSPPPALNDRELAHDGGRFRGTGCIQVRELCLAFGIVLARRSLTRMALPRAVEGDPVHKIAKLDVGSVLFRQPSQPVLSLAVRAEGTINPDDHRWKITQPLDHRCPTARCEQNENT